MRGAIPISTSVIFHPYTLMAVKASCVVEYVDVWYKCNNNTTHTLRAEVNVLAKLLTEVSVPSHIPIITPLLPRPVHYAHHLVARLIPFRTHRSGRARYRTIGRWWAHQSAWHRRTQSLASSQPATRSIVSECTKTNATNYSHSTITLHQLIIWPHITLSSYPEEIRSQFSGYVLSNSTEARGLNIRCRKMDTTKNHEPHGISDCLLSDGIRVVIKHVKKIAKDDTESGHDGTCSQGSCKEGLEWD